MKHFSKGICTHCGGSGQLLRPAKQKLLSFKQCSCCAGHGYRFKALKKPDSE